MFRVAGSVARRFELGGGKVVRLELGGGPACDLEVVQLEALRRVVRLGRCVLVGE